VLRRPLTGWDRRAAQTADRYLANSTFVADQVRRIYGLDAAVVHPPISIDVDGPQSPLPRIDSGYVLCVSRLLPYKNLEAVVRAFEHLRRERLVIVGDGPDENRLRSLAGPNVTFVGVLPDPELRWLYANARALVTASYEDFGLTPLEAAAFGKPTAALRFGGFLDTIVEGETGVFFDTPEPQAVAAALRRTLDLDWDVDALTRHVAAFSESRFSERMREVVAEELAAGA
jgi:glycosyltransferase involved in cell wall biosynthesis